MAEATPRAVPDAPEASGLRARGARARARTVPERTVCERLAGATIEDMPEATMESIEHAPRTSWSTIARIAAVGIWFDVAIAEQSPGISIPVLLAITVALLRSSFRRSWHDDLLLGCALLVSSFIAVRASEPLIAIDVLVALALFVAAAVSTPGSALRATVADAFRIAERGLLAITHAPGFIARPLAGAVRNTSFRRALPAVRAAVIALPILFVFAILLASADRVFADLLLPALPDIDLGSVPLHVSLIIIGMLGAATVWSMGALRERACVVDAVEVPRPKISPSEWMTVLGGINALFVLFVGVQLAVLFGGRTRVEVTPGLTYADYARSGFFQLIAVAFLTVLVIVLVWDLGTRGSARARAAFGALVGLMVGCTFVILASAWMRLGLYEDAFGATLARLGARFAILFIAFVLVATPVSMAVGARHRFASTVLLGAIAWLVVFNAVNPERLVAQRNAERFHERRKIDIAYVSSLGEDAVPVLVELLPDLVRSRRLELHRDLCVRRLRLGVGEPSMRSYNAARAAARDALATIDC